MPANELDGGDIVAPSAVEDTPTVTASKRNAEDDVEKDESKKPRVEVGATLTGADVKADQDAHKDGPSAAADTIPEPKFEGSAQPVAAADEDEDEEDEEDDDDDEEAAEGEDGDDSDDEISEDELAALQKEAGGDEAAEPAPASGSSRRPTRTTRADVDWKKADAELGAFEGDE